MTAFLLLPGSALADTVIAKRTIRSNAILTEDDFLVREGDTPGAVSQIADILGLEARNVLYQGRPVSFSDVGPAAIIERNQIVTLMFSNGPLVIAAEARALGRAGVGDVLRVMNIGSRKTISGIVSQNGTVVVGTITPASRR